MVSYFIHLAPDPTCDFLFFYVVFLVSIASVFSVVSIHSHNFVEVFWWLGRHLQNSIRFISWCFPFSMSLCCKLITSSYTLSEYPSIVRLKGFQNLETSFILGSNRRCWNSDLCSENPSTVDSFGNLGLERGKAAWHVLWFKQCYLSSKQLYWSISVYLLVCLEFLKNLSNPQQTLISRLFSV